MVLKNYSRVEDAVRCAGAVRSTADAAVLLRDLIDLFDERPDDADHHRDIGACLSFRLGHDVGLRMLDRLHLGKRRLISAGQYAAAFRGLHDAGA